MPEYLSTITGLRDREERAKALGAAAVDPMNNPAQSLGGGGDPAATPAGSGYVETIRLLGAREDAAARGALIGAVDVNPDAAAQALAISRQTGVPAPAVEADLPAWKAQAELQSNLRLIERNPVLRAWLDANPVAARVAKDDFERLDGISKAWKALASGWSEAFLYNERGRLGQAAMLGADVQERVGAIDKQIHGSPALQGLYGVLKSVSGFVGGTLDNFLQAGNQALQGAAIGAMGATAIPVPGISTAAGAIAGFGVGTGFGLKWDMARIAAGNAYLNIGKITDSAGNPVAEPAKQGAAVLTGLATYALVGIGMERFNAAAAEARAKLFGDAVAEAMTVPSVQRAMAQFAYRLGQAGIEGAAIMGALEAVNVAGEELAKSLGQSDFETVFNDPTMRALAVNRILTAAIEGAALFPIVKLPFNVGSFAGDAIRARQSRSDLETFAALEAGAADSKTRGRDLQAFRDFLTRQAEGSPVEYLYLNGEAVARLYQEMGVTPGRDDGLLGRVAPDIADQVAQTRITGGDVVLRTADYLAELAGTPVSERLRPDIKVRPEGFSLREAEAYEKARADFLADQAVDMRTRLEAEIRADEPGRQIADDLFAKLRAAGFTIDVARQYAALVAARYVTRAERLGKGDNPFELYKGEGIEVRRELPESLGRVVVDEGDMIINALRSGSRLASDRELFGPSLVEVIRRMGGVVDQAGELARLDPPKGIIAKLKAGESRAARGLDEAALKLWELGYFPEFTERPSPFDLVEAIGEELAGRAKRYAGGSSDEMRAAFKEAVRDLQEFVDRQGIDLQKATNAEVKKALQEYQASQGMGGRQFEQAAYHGSPFKFDQFTLDRIGGGEGNQAFGWGLYFASGRKVADFYRNMLSQLPREQIREVVKALPDRYRGGTDNGIRIVKDIGSALLSGEIEAPADYLKVYEVDASLRPAYKKAAKLIAARRNLYHVELLPKAEEYLDWDKPLHEQSGHVQAALKKLAIEAAPEPKPPADREIAALVRAALKQADGDPRQVGLTVDNDGALYRRAVAHAEARGIKDVAEAPGVGAYVVQQAREYLDALARRGDDTGEALYGRLREKWDERKGRGKGPELASKELLSVGIRGIRYLDAFSRDDTGGEATHNFVIFDAADAVIKSFEQTGLPGTRGSITLADGRAIIQLYKDANLSTFLHETGHLWLDELIRDASRPEAPAELRADLRAVVEWMKVADASTIGREQHEAFARAFEAYLLEGKAPSAALSGAFSRFKAWLVRLYQSIVALNTPINDELRGVFDRLLASDQEIAAQRQALALNPVFASAEAAGMTKAEYQAYTEGVAKARAAAEQRLLKRTMEEVRRRREAELEREAEALRDEVAPEIRARADLRAQYWLRTGRLLDDPAAPPAPPARLSREALKAMFGNDEAAALLPRGTYTNKGGVHPDVVAELFGYGSGEALVKALMSLEATRAKAAEMTGQKLDGARYLEYLVRNEVEARLRERHGDALTDGSIEAEALAAVHNAAQADVMAVELRQLARKAGAEAPVALKDIERWAAGALAQMPLKRGADVRAFARLEAKAGREAERALLKGKVDEAFLAKQRQLVAHVMARQAAEIAEQRLAGDKLFARYASRNVFPAVEQGFTDRIHEILKRIGYPTRRADEELAAGVAGKSLAEFVAGKEADGHELLVPAFLLDPGWRKTPDQMTVDEYLAVKDAVTSLVFNGRAEKTVRVEGAKVELQALADEAREQADRLPARPVSKRRNPGKGGRGMDALAADIEAFQSSLRSADASLLKMETVFDWLDGGNLNGVFNRVVFRRLSEAQNAETRLNKSVTAELLKAFAALPKDRVADLLTRYEVPELIDSRTGRASSLLKSEILAIALNWGNAGNREKLLKGEGWEEGQVQAALNRHMKAEDWRLVQRIWDIVNGLWPEIEAQERRLSGVPPAKVEATPVDTPHGTFAGGYYPLIYDPARDFVAEQRRQRAAAAMFENNYTKAATQRGHTIERVDGYSAPLLLSLDVLPRHLTQVIHDLTHREAVMDADKFLSHKTVREAVETTLGREVYKQFRPWLQSIANDANVDVRGLDFWDRLARRARTSATMVGMGFRATTMLAQVAGYSDVAEVIGARWAASGFKAFWGSPGKMKAARDFVFERSEEMASRHNQLDRDIREGLRAELGNTGLVANAKRFAFYGIGMMDMAVTIPAWLGAYNKGLSEKMTPADAAFYADKVVRTSQGAGAPKDLAAVQRGGEVMKLLTMFYSYFNHLYNRQRDLARSAGEAWREGRAGDLPMLAARAWWLLAVPPILGAILTGQGPKEDESLGLWAGQKLFFNLFMGVPVVRDIAGAADRGFGYQFTPAARAIDSLGKSAKDAGAGLVKFPPIARLAEALGMEEQPEVSDRWLRHAIETAGYVFGLPTGQAGVTGQYLFDVIRGEDDPEGTMDFMRGLIYGPKKEGK